MERFTIFRSQYECFKCCTPEIRLELSDAMFAYAFEGKEPVFKDKMSEAVWIAMLPVIQTSLRQSMNGSKNKKRQDRNKDSSQDIVNNEEVVVELPKQSVEENTNTPSFIVEYAKVKTLWENICGSSMGMIHKLTDSRKKKIRVRALEIEKSFGDYLVIFEKIFNLMADSSFMNGNNDRGWKPSFDWIIENDKNYVKVLEGKYNNNNTEQHGSRRLSERTAEESFYDKQSRIATSMLLQDGDCGLAGETQDDQVIRQ